MPRRTSIRACFGPFSHTTQQALRARRAPCVGFCVIFIRRVAVHAPALASLIGERRVRLARAGQTQNIVISVVFRGTFSVKLCMRAARCGVGFLRHSHSPRRPLRACTSELDRRAPHRIDPARVGQTENLVISVVFPRHIRRQALYALLVLWRRRVRYLACRVALDAPARSSLIGGRHVVPVSGLADCRHSVVFGLLTSVRPSRCARAPLIRRRRMQFPSSSHRTTGVHAIELD